MAAPLCGNAARCNSRAAAKCLEARVHNIAGLVHLHRVSISFASPYWTLDMDAGCMQRAIKRCVGES